MCRISTKWSLLVAALLVVNFAAGCGESQLVSSSDSDLGAAADAGSDAPNASVDAPIQPVSQFGAEMLAGQCEKLFECCSQDELDAMLGQRSESPDECASAQSLLASSVAFDQFDEAIADGRLIYDEAMADLCIESWAQRPCEDVRDTNIFASDMPGCREMLAPTVELGEACVEDIDCQSGYCAADEDGTTTCQRLPEAGQACPDLRCEADAYCSTFGSEYICEARRALGQACSSGRDCISGVCGEDENLDQVCQEPAALCPSASTDGGQ